MSIICLLIQFSFKSATETSECKAHVANSQWQRVPYRRAGIVAKLRDLFENIRVKRLKHKET